MQKKAYKWEVQYETDDIYSWTNNDFSRARINNQLYVGYPELVLGTMQKL